MNLLGRLRLALMAILLFSVAFATQAQAAPHNAVRPVKLIRSIPLPGFTGDFDHFAVDSKGHRLFLAGEDHKTVEIFDSQSGRRIHSITGFGTPHAIFYKPSADELYVTDGDDGTLKILSGADYKVISSIQLEKGADSIGYDRSADRLFVVTGGKDVPLDYSFLSAVDLRERKKLGDVRFEANHVEAMAIEQGGTKLFINITDKNQIAVIDRNAMKVMTTWTVGVAQENSPIALDEANKRLFVVCRKPGALVVINADSGAVVANLPAPGHSDDVAFDKDNHRIYVPGAEGYLFVFQQKDADHYEVIQKIKTAHGAKTALYAPELHRLFVAVSPGDTKAMAKVLIFDVAK